MNTQQLEKFNLHLLNGLVPMGIREICGLCSGSVFLTVHKAQPCAGGPSEGGKELPLIPQNTQIPLLLIKEQGMRQRGSSAQPWISGLKITEHFSPKTKPLLTSTSKQTHGFCPEQREGSWTD